MKNQTSILHIYLENIVILLKDFIRLTPKKKYWMLSAWYVRGNLQKKNIQHQLFQKCILGNHFASR